eukprot:TRINITY_DN67780_c0_g1_i1.p1 TRINITY_DN67780_c0_g1~~TRINITY_DN67780_c0_g1_i1.p1  ORF type:complete len:525 (-),score=108.65 TRINITY_DN67780_c0_g1_i1:3-1577(-)
MDADDGAGRSGSLLSGSIGNTDKWQLPSVASPARSVRNPPLADAEQSETSEVVIVHHDDMQLHVPPRYREIYELPRRVIAIENRLKGLEVREGFPPECNFGGRMQLLPASSPVAFGSPAPKKRRRQSYSSGPSTDGSAWDACRIVEAPEVQDSDILLVHSEQHLAEVIKACKLARSEAAAFQPLSPCAKTHKKIPQSDDVNSDVYYSPDSLTAFRRAAGGAVQAVRELFRVDEAGRARGRSSVNASFAIVRPPGHHCCSEPAGFCFFNNSAIAASHALEVLGLSRVAIIDWDYHHGDGTQKLFYQDPRVLTISLHVALSGEGLAFPNNKGMDWQCLGKGAGLGCNINIPWPHDGVGLAEYRDAFDTVIIPALEGFRPELIVVASGFDAVVGDMLAGTCLPASGYYDLSLQLMALGLPVAVILEGGYSPSLIAEAAANVVHALLGREMPPQKQLSPSSAAKKASTGMGPGEGISVSCVLDAIRRHLNATPFWKALSDDGSEKYFREESAQESAKAASDAASMLSA